VSVTLGQFLASFLAGIGGAQLGWWIREQWEKRREE